ncbi:MAG TPA: DNA mismatch repair protein MutS [Thermoanaerobaculia bacterium]|nr:DNA mismatch repair protein MutS [Thermoanaerobaculia bacterium]
MPPSTLKLTPMLEQYLEIKRQVPDAILFYRLGDFYEMFFEDAKRAAPILDLVLTARGKGGESEFPMCGVPYHAAEQYIARLIRRGFRVAICEQTEEASQAKGLVRREIVRIVTPGTAIDGSIIDAGSCYLLAWAPAAESTGAAYLDSSTGDFFVTRYSGIADPRFRDDVARYSPREVIFASEAGDDISEQMSALGLAPTPLDGSSFDSERAEEYLTRHFHTQTLRGFGLEKGDERIAAAGAALRYATTSYKRELTHVSSLRAESDAECLLLDSSTLDNLEIFESRDSRARATLWGIVNQTQTAMGARALRRWICRPLRDHDSIFDRHDAVDEMTRSRLTHDAMISAMARIADLERLVSRITLRSAGPRETLALADSIEAIADLKGKMRDLAGPLLLRLRDSLDVLQDVRDRITATVEPSAPVTLRDGGVIRAGVHAELDALRGIAHDSKSILLRIEEGERVRTGITSLKVRFNSVFGYYLEVSKTNLGKVPPDYIRKQTLVNAERFITPELKVLEEKILGAEEKSLAIEEALFEELLGFISDHSQRILNTGRAAADIDSLSALATLAIKQRYIRPQLSPAFELCITDGRHPVIETLTRRFIPNDTDIDRDRNGIHIITGPNMGGKSTYLRQVALIVLLNQIGSFVPATQARLGIFDRIFTRVGASDNLARGESTFMVEMHETANILNNATNRSLIVLDEVGRGTATFDGLSLAWAIVEFLHDTASRAAITLFATHYHELTDLANSRSRITNMNVAVKEWNDQIIFLHKVVPGAADKSYGIQVAKLAGIPQQVIERSRQVLRTLEKKEREVVDATRVSDPGKPESHQQMGLFETMPQRVARELAETDLDGISPIEALNRLHEWKRRLGE